MVSTLNWTETILDRHQGICCKIMEKYYVVLQASKGKTFSSNTIKRVTLDVRPGLFFVFSINNHTLGI